MSSYPETIDVFDDLDSTDNISSSDPNHAFESIENIEGFLGGMGKPQTWSETLLSIMRNYRRGMRVDNGDGSLYARAGEAVLVSTGANKTVFRRNPDDVALTTANIDDGTIAAEYYYVYAKGDALALTAPICFSSDYYAPSGIGTAPYKKLGWFKNCAAGSLAVTFAGSWKEFGDVPNAAIGSFYDSITITSLSFAAFPTTPCKVHIATSGRPIEIMANMNIGFTQSTNVTARITIDGIEKAIQFGRHSNAGNEWWPLTLYYMGAEIVAGTHVIEVEAKIAAGVGANISGAGDGAPIMLTAKEL